MLARPSLARKRAGEPPSFSASISASRVSGPGFGHLSHGVFDQEVHHRFCIARSAKYFKLPVGPCAFANYVVDMVKGLAGAKVIGYILNEIAQLQGELAHRLLGALPEIYEQPIYPVPGRPPLVLHDQRA